MKLTWHIHLWPHFEFQCVFLKHPNYFQLHVIIHTIIGDLLNALFTLYSSFYFFITYTQRHRYTVPKPKKIVRYMQLNNKNSFVIFLQWACHEKISPRVQNKSLASTVCDCMYMCVCVCVCVCARTRFVVIIVIIIIIKHVFDALQHILSYRFLQNKK
jgi:hypothetical protein